MPLLINSIFLSNILRSHIQHQKFHTNLLAMASHDAEFKSAQEKVGTLKEDPGNMAKLQLYALFKQASIISVIIVNLKHKHFMSIVY